MKAAAGFTLIETMLAVLLMALLAGAVAMNLSQPMQAARAADAIELVRSFDTLGRQASVTSGHNVRLVFDLATGTLAQRDGPDLMTTRSQIALPQGCHIDAVRIGGHLISAGQGMIDISSRGWSRSYAVQLSSPRADRWLVFAGMSGQMTQVLNESQIPIFRAMPRHDAD